MLVTLIGKNSIHTIKLPQTPLGNYWISDKSGETEKKLINIEGKDENWQIVTNNKVKAINPKALNIENDIVKISPETEITTQRIILKENNMYGVCIGGFDNFYIIYCSPIFENDLIKLTVKNTQEIFIGKGEKNHIVYNNKLVANTHARIFIDSNELYLENFDKKFGTCVNNKMVSNEIIKLYNGDKIFIMGLTIIIMGQDIIINNPSNNMKYNNNYLSLNDENHNIDIVKNTNDEEEEIYEDNYFTRSPRIINRIKKEVVKIDAPPQIESKEEAPMMLVLGSTLSMGAMILISGTRTLDSQINSKQSSRQMIFQIAIILLMLLGMILIPILNVKYNKKKKKKYEEKRQQRYKEYIDSKIEIIDEAMYNQREILLENNLSTEKCQKLILDKDKKLWERKLEDEDFLTVRLGIGDVPLEIDIRYPEERFMMEDDNLIDILNSVAKKSKILQRAPIKFSLIEHRFSAIISHDEELRKKYLENLLIQLIALQSYDDLKLVFLLKEDKQEKWEELKMLPYFWNENKKIRFFADNYNDMEKVSKYLEEIAKQRIEEIEEKKYDNGHRVFKPYYLIITDDYKHIENLRIIQEILKEKENIGFGLLSLSDNVNQLPNENQSFINLEDKEGQIFENEITEDSLKTFKFNLIDNLKLNEITAILANIPIKYDMQGKSGLPSSYNFLEMYDVGLIEQLNVLERWNKNDSTLSLEAPIGIDSAGRLIGLDIHEKFHGPHGLIAGSTGSGKSEFIITYILSMAINYNPNDVAFVLIDYKGGGLAGAFQKGNIKLPHLVGTITNIDTVGLQRSLASIQSELRRRQIAFNKARDMTDEGTIDIYKYQKLYHEGIVKKPIPHLLIICDEFAELKQQQPDFMDELISVSRIGRSLGVHLILATQKPAGIVNDQIRSNSRFAVCLKVQTKQDSNDVINKPDAAQLKGEGQFYIEVGNDEYFNLGQAAWSGAQYLPSNVIKKKVDSSIEFISNIGATIKSIDDTVQRKSNAEGEQLTRIVQYLNDIANKEKIKLPQLWLDSIPEDIYFDDIKKKYKIEHEETRIMPLIGEYDDPYNQRQDAAIIDFDKVGNVVIFGNAESGKESLLSTICYDFIKNYTTKEVWTYILDFGSEALKIFKEAPHVGDTIFIGEEEKIKRFFEYITQEIKNRKKILSDYNGDYKLYVKETGQILPTIIVIINNYGAFADTYQMTEYDDMILSITREGLSCGIKFIFTVNSFNNIRYRLIQNFKYRIALNLNSDDEYYNVFDKIGKKRPSHNFGRGILKVDDELYEFQTAKICEASEYNNLIKTAIDEAKRNNKIIAKPVQVLPEKVTFDDLKKDLNSIASVPIGITDKDLRVLNYNFSKNIINLITSKNFDEVIEFTGYIIDEIRQLDEVNVIVFDAEKIWANDNTNVRNEYEIFTFELEKNLKKDIHNICIIIGLDKFLNAIGELATFFINQIKKAEEKGNYNFIIVDSASKIKLHEYDPWYKSFIGKEDGIWVGNGFNDQYLINISTNRRDIVNNCGCSMGYAVKGGTPIFVKLLEMKDKGDDYE